MATGIYVHLPFCRVHCTYCAFAISTDLALQDAYASAVLREIGAAPAGEKADSLYFGGGTPSRMNEVNLRAIAGALRAQYDIDPAAEITLEANPEDVNDAALTIWRRLGVNRLSIGVQSFHDGELLAIGRVHDRSAAIAAVRAAEAAGFRTSLDLILGLPTQTGTSFRESLRQAIGLGAGHLSLYMLDLEERSPLEVQVRRGRQTLPDDELVSDLYLEAVDSLAAAGLHQYEISNFARPGQESRHNLRYWRRDAYRGFGLGAHSFSGRERFANTRDIRRYIALSPEARDFAEMLGDDEVRHESLFLGLRQAGGMCYEDVVRLTGEEGIRWTERGTTEGWLRREGERVAFTPAGFLQSNELISQLF
jgi:oxygen-independent coproporphyrinogen-3 oxidase